MVVTYCGSCACRTVEPPCTCECHATELARLRARAEKAEAEFSTRLETIKKDRREWMDRCDKAEAERDEARKIKSSQRLSRELALACQEVADERARADRYLAAMQDAVRAYDRLAKGGYGGDLAVAWATLRALVEARRG